MVDMPWNLAKPLDLSVAYKNSFKFNLEIVFFISENSDYSEMAGFGLAVDFDAVRIQSSGLLFSFHKQSHLFT